MNGDVFGPCRPAVRGDDRAEAALGLQATYFELMIAAAFLAFREAGTDLNVVEVGMGGRWDATNVVEPDVAVAGSAEGWHLLSAQADHIADGYTSQDMVIWNEAGLPLLVARQTIAVFV